MEFLKVNHTDKGVILGKENLIKYVLKYSICNWCVSNEMVERKERFFFFFADKIKGFH